MPVNTSSTGATYGKSSDPLCPLGFHPQVRWPTRCKRCFRDYKEHSDSKDKARFGHVSSGEDNPWNNGQRSGFQRSKSLDVSSSPCTSSLSSDEIPDWRRRMIERQKKAEENALVDKEIMNETLGEFRNDNQLRSRSVQPETKDKEGKETKTVPCETTKVGIHDVTETFERRELEPTKMNFKNKESLTPHSLSFLNSPFIPKETNASNSWSSSFIRERKEKEDKERKEKEEKERKVKEEKEIKDKEAKERKVKEEKERKVKEEKERKVKEEKERKVKEEKERKVKEAKERKDKEDNNNNIGNLSSLSGPSVKLSEETSIKRHSSNHEEKQKSQFSSSSFSRDSKQNSSTSIVKDPIKNDEEHTRGNCKIEKYKENDLLSAPKFKDLFELQSKYKALQIQYNKLEGENNILINSVNNLEGELEEVQDNFREDEMDEYRTLKRELEIASKNLRILSFKLKKAEKYSLEVEREKNEMELRIKKLSESSSETLGQTSVSKNHEESEKAMFGLDNKSTSSNQGRQESVLKKSGPVYRRNGSLERSDELSKELQDSIEREKDLKEQLLMAEEESEEMRRKFSRLEDENESLASQIKRLSAKVFGVKKSEKPESENLSPKELKFQLEVADTDCAAYRNKMDKLLTENLKLSKELKEITALRDKERNEKRQNQFSSSSSSLTSSSSLSTKDIITHRNYDVILSELNDMRVKYNEKEHEFERMESELKSLHESSTQRNNTTPTKSNTTLNNKTEDINYKIIELEKEISSLKHTNFLYESEKNKRVVSSDSERNKERNEKLEKEISALKIKNDTFSRELIALEREKRRSEEEREREKQRNEEITTSLRDERDRITREMEESKRKHEENLKETAKGVQAFKDIIAVLKRDLEEEKRKKIEKISQYESNNETLHQETKLKLKDLEDKWSKSKRINAARLSKIESLERKLEEEVLSKKKCIVVQGSSYDEEKCLQLTQERDELILAYSTLSKDHEVLVGELQNLRGTYNTMSDTWIKEKLYYLEKMKESENLSADKRYKQILEDRDAQISQLKIENDVSRSQVSSLKKDVDDLRFKLADYEKMTKFQRVASGDYDKEKENYKAAILELNETLIQERKSRRNEMSALKSEYNSLLETKDEESISLKTSSLQYKREKETYKEMYERLQRTLTKDSENEYCETESKIQENNLHLRIQSLEVELSETKNELCKALSSASSQKSFFEVQICELSSVINEYEESAILESGRSKIAGSRTKMELAWQKERESQKKCIIELNRMTKDLKGTLLEVQREKEKMSLESKRQIAELRSVFSEESEETKKQVEELEYDLLELKDAHAKLRTANEKYRRDKEKSEKEREELKIWIKENSKIEEEDNVWNETLKQLNDFLVVIPKILGSDILVTSSRSEDAQKTQFKSLFFQLQRSKEELENLRRRTEEANCLRRQRETNSSSRDSSTPTPTARTSRKSSNLYRKTLSIGDSIHERSSDKVWRCESGESLTSSASIPLPIPIRTRSAGESLSYTSDSIRRLERDTSCDRTSVGSRDSNNSEWDKKSSKKSSLIGKLRKLTQTKKERDFGSGSDISTASKNSHSIPSTQISSNLSKVSQRRSASRERGSLNLANEPFDKIFETQRANSSNPPHYLGTFPRNSSLSRKK